MPSKTSGTALRKPRHLLFEVFHFDFVCGMLRERASPKYRITSKREVIAALMGWGHIAATLHAVSTLVTASCLRVISAPVRKIVQSFVFSGSTLGGGGTDLGRQPRWRVVGRGAECFYQRSITIVLSGRRTCLDGMRFGGADIPRHRADYLNGARGQLV